MSAFLGRVGLMRPSTRTAFACGRSLRAHVSNGVRVSAFFKLGGTNAKDGGIYGSQGRDDYFDIDIEHYFNYTGALAIDGSYDRMYAFADLGLEPIDTILLLAAEENDFPKVEEVLEAGALTSVKDVNGKLPVELATKPEVVELLQKYMANQNVPLP